MDILDIDAILKDDSFCLLEEKLQDDVTNIIQQWKINDNKQDVFDSRTFTRGKRKSFANLESQMKNSINNATANINLKIGGPVTQKQKCFLNDISPPNSVCSSMELNSSDNSNDMFNSLITSADFSNVSFLGLNKLDDVHNISSNNDMSLSHNSEKHDTIANDDSASFKSALSELTNNSSHRINNILDHTIILNDKNNKEHQQNNTFNLDDLPNKTTNINNTFTLNETNLSEINLNSTFVTGENKKLENIHNTPDNINRSLNNRSIVTQSTPQIKNVSCEFDISPISSEKETKRNSLTKSSSSSNSNSSQLQTEDDDVLSNDIIDLEKNVSELLSFEKNEEKFDYLFEDIKTNNANEVMRQSLNSIKKRFSYKTEKSRAPEFDHPKAEVILSTSTEKLLSKRGTLYENSKIQNLPLTVAPRKINAHNSDRDRFKTITINRKPIISDVKLKNSEDLQYFRENSNSPIPNVTTNQIKTSLMRPNQLNVQAKYSMQNRIINDHNIEDIYSETLCKAISASDLEKSTCTEKEVKIVQPVLKSPMGTKAKSFHNLASNNFGFARRPYNQTVVKQAISNNSTDDKLFTKIPNPTSNIRPAMNKRKGLVRPSTGIYSQTTTTNVKVENVVNKIPLSLPNEDKRIGNDSYIGVIKNVNDYSNKEMNVLEKMKINASSGLPAPSNIRRSRLARPTVYLNR